MRKTKKWFLFPLTLAVLIVVFLFGFSRLNRYQREGTLVLPGLKEAGTVTRDEKGMAHIYAQNTDDAFLAFGFITAQDRLFQMELIKLLATGRISEMMGEKESPSISG